MREWRKFDMGLPTLASNENARFESAIDTGLKFFDSRETNELFIAKGYIWRSFQIIELGNYFNETTRGKEEVATLQYASKFASDAFNQLKAKGLSFEGHFIVHDINDVPSLVCAVPVVDGKEMQHLKFSKTEEWEELHIAFIVLYEALLSYFDECVSTKKPILWDISSIRQYMYGTTELSKEKALYLVDPDPRLEDHPAFMHRFANRARASIQEYIENSKNVITQESGSRLLILRKAFEDRTVEYYNIAKKANSGNNLSNNSI